MPDGERESGELAPVTFTCYRVELGEREVPADMNMFSVVVVQPDGVFRHQVIWARSPEDMGESIRVQPGSRVFATQMANNMVWDSGATEATAGSEAAPAA